MVAMADLNLPDKAIRHQVASAINVIVQVARMADGSRRVTNISEITGMEGDVITMQDIFVFERTGINAAGPGDRTIPRDRHPAEGERAPRGGGHSAAGASCSSTCRSSSRSRSAVWIVAAVFVGVVAIVLGAYWLLVVRQEERVPQAADASHGQEPQRLAGHGEGRGADELGRAPCSRRCDGASWAGRLQDHAGTVRAEVERGDAAAADGLCVASAATCS